MVFYYQGLTNILCQIMFMLNIQKKILSIKFIIFMENNIFLMTKTPIHGLIKKRLAKDIGNCKSKLFTLLNIQSIKKILIHKKNYKLFIYTTPKKKFRTFSFNIHQNVFSSKRL